MLTLVRNLAKISSMKINVRCISFAYSSIKIINEKYYNEAERSNSLIWINSLTFPQIQFNYLHSQIEAKRYFSKKKGSKRYVEVEEDSESEEENESYETYKDSSGGNIITRSAPSTRLDTVVKIGLNVSKKKVEKDFYASKIRLNNERVLKKSLTVSPGDEIDLVKGFSPENQKFLVIDRIIIKGIDKITGNAMYPIKMEILKGLIIENYELPWSPSSVQEIE